MSPNPVLPHVPFTFARRLHLLLWRLERTRIRNVRTAPRKGRRNELPGVLTKIARDLRARRIGVAATFDDVFEPDRAGLPSHAMR
jgi:hypothetical protein